MRVLPGPDGAFREPFDPTAINYGSDYTEGNAWQYSWFVPHDPAGLIAANVRLKSSIVSRDERESGLRKPRWR